MFRRASLTIRSMALAAALAGPGLVSATSAATAAAAPPAATLTVGEFLIQYAKSVQIVLPPDASAEAAFVALKAAGALRSLELALDRPLTHGDVVKIGKASGLRITTSTPDKLLEKPEAALFLEAFARYLVPSASASGDRVAASDNPAGDPAGRANTDKGKKKGRPFQSTSEPENAN